MADDFEQVEVKSRAELRQWLAAHHRQTRSVWLITYRRSAGILYLPYSDLVEEALCFGWIDSRPRSLDERRTMHLLSQRKPGSAWSKDNKQRAERLIRSGLMSDAGMAKIEQAKKDGSWDFLDDVQKSRIPDDLAEALSADPKAAAYFEAFPPSSKRIILEWIKGAKQPATRAKRVADTVEKAARNIRANHYRQ